MAGPPTLGAPTLPVPQLDPLALQQLHQLPVVLQNYIMPSLPANVRSDEEASAAGEDPPASKLPPQAGGTSR